ncbi:MAG: hypothetical protein MUF14_03750 [Hyphomonadaceae bacterium]|nr:hypothetical protein [Hyphomonadaceae bacterium]
MIVRNSLTLALVAGCVALTGCNPAAPGANDAAPVPAAAAGTAAAPSFTAAADAKPETLAPAEADSEGEAASLGGVVRFDAVPNQSGDAFVRLIGTGGGDPAANGLMTYLVISTTHDSWVYTIGNILEYRIKGAADGKLDLEIDETIVADNGDMGNQTRKVIVTWTAVPADYSPGDGWSPTVTVTAAQ